MQFLTCFKYNFLHTLESPKWVTILATQPDAEEYPFSIRAVRISGPPIDALGAMMMMSELQRRARYHCRFSLTPFLLAEYKLWVPFNITPLGRIEHYILLCLLSELLVPLWIWSATWYPSREEKLEHSFLCKSFLITAYLMHVVLFLELWIQSPIFHCLFRGSG